MEDKNKPLYSVDKRDFEMQTFCTGGNGGQNQNRRKMGCRLIHRESGAVGEGREERSFEQNKKNAFRKLINTDKFQKWLKIQTAKALGTYVDTEEWVKEQMQPENLKIEGRNEEGKWEEI